MPIEDLKQDRMFDHLLESLERGEDIGEYGRLVFAMVGRHFLDEDELTEWLAKDGSMDLVKARALVRQVDSRDYNPPKRERILEWAGKQGFPICPDASDPDACNPYRTLDFPEKVYQRIQAYRERKAEADLGD
jgi:hypothetical protein